VDAPLTPAPAQRRTVTLIAALGIIAAGSLALWAVLRAADPGASAVANIAPVAGVGGQVAAMVSDEPVYVYDITREAASQGLAAQGQRLAPGDTVYDQVLQELIDQKLLAQAAEASGLAATPEARRRLETARERILGNVLLENEVGAKVTDEAIRRMYDEQTRLVEMGDEVRPRHILVATRADAETLLARIAAGEDFAALAFELSLDEATRLEGGDLGYVTQDTLTPELATAAYATPIGQVSAPVESDLGWHIVKVEDRRASPRPSFETLRPRIVRFMTFDTIQQLLATLRDGADIEIMAPEIPPASPGDSAPPGPDPMAEFLQATPVNPAAGLRDDTAAADPAPPQ
jgi:peptidyl-prolyl cis-trans isomerase C